MVEKHRARLQAIQNDRLAGLRKLADDLGRQSITIEANANDEGHLYGSVGAPKSSRRSSSTSSRSPPIRSASKARSRNWASTRCRSISGQEIEGELKVWVVPMVSDQEHPAEPKSAEPKTPPAKAT